VYESTVADKWGHTTLGPFEVYRDRDREREREGWKGERESEGEVERQRFFSNTNTSIPDVHERYANLWDSNPGEARFLELIRTGHKIHPLLYNGHRVSFLGEERPARDADHLPPSIFWTENE
jgi:hypothetical protein